MSPTRDVDPVDARFAEAERLLALPPAGRETLRGLAALRRRLAKDAGLPAFRILTNRHLLALSERRPASEAELAGMPGIGPSLARAYGAEILAVIKAQDADIPV